MGDRLFQPIPRPRTPRAAVPAVRTVPAATAASASSGCVPRPSLLEAYGDSDKLQINARMFTLPGGGERSTRTRNSAPVLADLAAVLVQRKPTLSFKRNPKAPKTTAIIEGAEIPPHASARQLDNPERKNELADEAVSPLLALPSVEQQVALGSGPSSSSEEWVPPSTSHKLEIGQPGEKEAPEPVGADLGAFPSERRSAADMRAMARRRNANKLGVPSEGFIGLKKVQEELKDKIVKARAEVTASRRDHAGETSALLGATPEGDGPFSSVELGRKSLSSEAMVRTTLLHELDHAKLNLPKRRVRVGDYVVKNRVSQDPDSGLRRKDKSFESETEELAVRLRDWQRATDPAKKSKYGTGFHAHFDQDMAIERIQKSYAKVREAEKKLGGEEKESLQSSDTINAIHGMMRQFPHLAHIPVDETG